ncbi:hypothetical protein RvY_18822 [Ramazzottius varieornatus]|uniref:Uncharacterized protein n=1 Tax=Ramazzottius varieornatus TaxID=947166 RepID=A0A1D1W761_RAMVA|nr:hypothetical protein RvY_18822 [Ramazzottius varieornatus]
MERMVKGSRINASGWGQASVKESRDRKLLPGLVVGWPQSFHVVAGFLSFGIDFLTLTKLLFAQTAEQVQRGIAVKGSSPCLNAGGQHFSNIRKSLSSFDLGSTLNDVHLSWYRLKTVGRDGKSRNCGRKN